jgi:hypothetical protein
MYPEGARNVEERADSGKGFHVSLWEGAIRWKEDGRGVIFACMALPGERKKSGGLVASSSIITS